MKLFGKLFGETKLTQKLFGDKQEITWLKHADWVHVRMTLTRGGNIDWKNEDLYDHDTDLFVGTYTLEGTEDCFTVIGKGKSTAYYDAYKDTASTHRNKDVIKKFESSSFTGEGFTVTYK